jgi:hypothetical protein
MAIALTCPICGKKLAVPDKAAGKQCKCPQCHEPIAVPSVIAVPVAKPRKPPQPPETEPEQYDADRCRYDERDEDEDAERPRKRVKDNERTRRRAKDEAAQAKTDVAGVVSLVAGCLAVASMLLGLVVFAVGHEPWLADVMLGGAITLAIVGGVTGWLGRGNIRVAALTLNTFVLIPAALMIAGLLLYYGLHGDQGVPIVTMSAYRACKEGDRVTLLGNDSRCVDGHVIMVVTLIDGLDEQRIVVGSLDDKAMDISGDVVVTGTVSMKAVKDTPMLFLKDCKFKPAKKKPQ